MNSSCTVLFPRSLQLYSAAHPKKLCAGGAGAPVTYNPEGKHSRNLHVQADMCRLAGAM